MTGRNRCRAEPAVIVGGWLRRALVALAFFSMPISPAVAEQHGHLTLGVFSYRPDYSTEQRFQPLARYLSEATGQKIELQVLNHEDMRAALSRNQLDFVLTNPSHFLVLRSERSLTGVLATLIERWGSHETSSMGGVIVTRSDNTRINELQDLTGARVAISGPRFLGGYQAQARELQNVGVDADRDLVLLSVGHQDGVIEAVISGQADAGFVRTGLIEDLADASRLRVDRLKVINSQDLMGYPFRLSTRLYPEWPFVALPHVDGRIVRSVASALLALDGEHPAAKASGIAGFSPPADYQSVELMARTLRASPYDQIPTLSWAEFWGQYRYWVSTTALLILLLSLAACWLWYQRYTMARQQRLAATVFAHSREGVFITGPDRRVIDVNEAYTEITGKPRDSMIRHIIRFSEAGDEEAILRVAREQGFWTGEFWSRRANGESFACVLTISSVFSERRQLTHYVGVFSDITALKEQEQRLRRLAHFDPLTGLPNRVLLADRLHQSMALALRQRRRLALAYIDLDGFKAINDAHGHKAGDDLLVDVARRMRDVLRDQDTLARLGGDEFVALIVDSPGRDLVDGLLRRLLAAAAEVILVGGTRLQVSASIGVAFFPQQEDLDADQLLRQADQAMYLAKQTGRNRYFVFDHEQERSIRSLHTQLEHLKEALEHREFVLYYQPKVNMTTGAMIGAEALIRWQHPEHGLLPPSAFLPLMAGHPLLLQLGEWVLEEALRQHQVWRELGYHVPVAVNVDSEQLASDHFMAHIRHLLERYPTLQPGALTLEILETSALENLGKTADIIRRCKALGIVFAVDDFGTGYSSLNYLKQLPAAELKIDQSFVRGMRDDPDNLAILDGVIALSRAFRRSVIAEGVETEEHGTMLIKLGCLLGQGYFIARPMPAADFPDWLASWRVPDAWRLAAERVSLP